MVEARNAAAPDPCGDSSEVIRLNKIIRALMDRAEASTSIQGTDFTMFQTAVMLEARVRARTDELQAALRQNETITQALRESEVRFRGVVSQSLIGIATIEDGRFTYSNDKFDEIFGYSGQEMRELGPLDLSAPCDRALVAEMFRRHLNAKATQVAYNFRGLRKDGTLIDVELHGSRMVSGERPVLISLALDISERCRAERELAVLQEQLREQSTHDPLTGLYNRRYLEDSFLQDLVRAGRAGHNVSLIMADLDHFKAVNDRHGHLAGDEVLRTFGSLLRRYARASDTCSRYGGEEFLIVLPDMAEGDALARAEHLRAAVAGTPVNYEGGQIAVTASFGVASFPQHGHTCDSLIAAADAAMYEAKSAGRNRARVASAVSRSSRVEGRGPVATPR